MEEKSYEEIAKKCLDLGVRLHHLVRDMRLAVAHEAMIRSGGNLEKAAKSAGVDKATLSSYLGMGSRDWNEEYGDEI